MPLKLPIFFRLICSMLLSTAINLSSLNEITFACYYRELALFESPSLRPLAVTAAFSARANTCSPWTAVFPVFRPAWRRATSFPHFFTKITIHDPTIGFSCSFRCFSMIGWLNYHVTFYRNDITCGVTLSQNGRKYPVNPYQLWTMSFCTARRASLRTLGSLWDIIFITLTLQPRFSSTLRIKEHTHSDWKHKSFVENSLR